MKTIDLDGDYYSIGRQEAESGDMDISVEGAPVSDELIELFEKFIPGLLEEVRTIAAATAGSFRHVAGALLTGTANDAFCSMCAFLPERTNGGGVLVGRNYDFEWDGIEERGYLFLTNVHGKSRSVGTNELPVGRQDGLNDKGLYVGFTGMALPGTRPGINFLTMVRFLLDECGDIEQCLRAFEYVPQSGSANYLIADRTGAAVVVEAHTDGLEVRQPNDGFIAATNHAVSDGLRGRESFIFPFSYERYARLEDLAGRIDSATMDDVKRILSDELLCGVPERPDRQFGTLWTTVAKPGEGEFCVTSGPPKNSEYLRYRI